jgi:FkbM family methyltransferase
MPQPSSVREVTSNGIPLFIEVRSNTKDTNVVDEVIVKRCYRHTRHHFDVEEGERWLDLGAHIGCFSLYALSRGASEVKAFEPHPSNVEFYLKNLRKNFPEDEDSSWTIEDKVISSSKDKTLPLYETSSGNNTKFTSLRGKRTKVCKEVKNANFAQVVNKFEPDGIKVDIEGAEHGILDQIEEIGDFPSKMVIEYHFTKDNLLENFKRRIDKLSKVFKVNYPAHLDRMIQEGLTEFPGHFDRVIYCER